ncbi:hypothetical protein QY96_01254 [Bacillus thermotolerans]|nr:hypothetical protein QY96_01254 [Bacillus thermotolerans]
MRLLYRVFCLVMCYTNVHKNECLKEAAAGFLSSDGWFLFLWFIDQKQRLPVSLDILFSRPCEGKQREFSGEK